MSISLSVTTVNKIVDIWEILLASVRNINAKGRERTDESYFKRYFRIVRLSTLYKSFCVNRLIPLIFYSFFLIFFSILLIFSFAPMCDTIKGRGKKFIYILYLQKKVLLLTHFTPLYL